RPGTALYDAVVLSASTLKGQLLPGRVLVLLTDGHDVGSTTSFSQALRAAKRANVVVYTIALGQAADSPLRRLAIGTGGSFYASPTAAALTKVYRRIGSELDHTWKVSYTSNARPGDRITISVGSRRGPSRAITLPGRPSTAYKPFIPRFLLNHGAGVIVLVALIAMLIFLAVARLRAIPRADRLRQLVWDHTDFRASGSRREGHRRPTFDEVVASVNSRLRAMPHMEGIDKLVEAAAFPASAATILVASVV